MKNMRGLKLLVYVAFGLLIVHDVLPDARRGFIDGWNDGADQAHGTKNTEQVIPAMLSNSNLASPIGSDLKINQTYTLHNISLNADVAVTGNTESAGWVTAILIVLVFGIAITLIMVAYSINRVIMNISTGDMFSEVCISYIRRTGTLLLVYCVADVIYQRMKVYELRQVIHAPLQILNTTSFNFEALICAILAFIVAEAFKQGAILKHEQDLTI